MLAVVVVLVGAVAGPTAPPASAAARTGASPDRVRLTLALRPRDPAALARYARAVATPGSPRYGHYLTPRRFAARFGAGRARISFVSATLRARGLDPGRPSAGGLSISLHATAARLRSAAVATLARSEPRAVQGIVGSVAAHPLAVRAPQAALARAGRTTVHARAASSAGPSPCPAAVAAASQDSAYTDNQIAGAYGFNGLYAAGDKGAGTTVAVYELEPDDPADISAFQACYNTHARVSYVHVDGGAGAGAGSDEAAFDIENLIGFAPTARVLVYQGPNSNSGLPGSGPYDVFSAIVNQNRARVVSVSWGQCEAALGISAQKAEHALFEQAAVQGQTIVAAAGDLGAEDCDVGAHASAAPATDDPASQPDVTGVGGTTLSSTGPPPEQTAWNSGGPDPMATPVGAGGGGVSALWPMAGDQLDTPAFLNVRRGAAAGAACGRPSGYCREVPDVAADADPLTGYEIYWNGADTEPEPSGWQGLGGTSGAAPLWAALFALADSSPACDGSPLGDAGPAVYRAAAGHYGQDFDDVTTGDNDFTGTDGGRWPAGPGYDLTTGLGTPNATALVASLCADSARLSAPGAQSSAAGAAVALRLRGHDVRGARLRYRASHLPPGVQVNPVSGRLTGRPRTAGRFVVDAIVRDGRGAQSGTTFQWTIGGSPHLTRAQLLGTGTRRRLDITVISGAHAPWLRRLRVHVPAGLAPGRAVRVSARASAQASVRVRRSVVMVSLHSPAPSVTLAIPVHGRTAATRVSVGARAGSTGTSVLAAALTGVQR